jgi:hypothetical protein
MSKRPRLTLYQQAILDAGERLDARGIFPSSEALSGETGIACYLLNPVKCKLRKLGAWRWSRQSTSDNARAHVDALARECRRGRTRPIRTVATMDEWRRRAGHLIHGPGG